MPKSRLRKPQTPSRENSCEKSDNCGENSEKSEKTTRVNKPVKRDAPNKKHNNYNTRNARSTRKERVKLSRKELDLMKTAEECGDIVTPVRLRLSKVIKSVILRLTKKVETTGATIDRLKFETATQSKSQPILQTEKQQTQQTQQTEKQQREQSKSRGQRVQTINDCKEYNGDFVYSDEADNHKGHRILFLILPYVVQESKYEVMWKPSLNLRVFNEPVILRNASVLRNVEIEGPRRVYCSSETVKFFTPVLYNADVRVFSNMEFHNCIFDGDFSAMVWSHCTFVNCCFAFCDLSLNVILSCHFFKCNFLFAKFDSFIFMAHATQCLIFESAFRQFHVSDTVVLYGHPFHFVSDETTCDMSTGLAVFVHEDLVIAWHSVKLNRQRLPTFVGHELLLNFDRTRAPSVRSPSIVSMGDKASETAFYLPHVMADNVRESYSDWRVYYPNCQRTLETMVLERMGMFELSAYNVFGITDFCQHADFLCGVVPLRDSCCDKPMLSVEEHNRLKLSSSVRCTEKAERYFVVDNDTSDVHDVSKQAMRDAAQMVFGSDKELELNSEAFVVHLQILRQESQITLLVYDALFLFLCMLINRMFTFCLVNPKESLFIKNNIAYLLSRMTHMPHEFVDMAKSWQHLRMLHNKQYVELIVLDDFDRDGNWLLSHYVRYCAAMNVCGLCEQSAASTSSASASSASASSASAVSNTAQSKSSGKLCNACALMERSLGAFANATPSQHLFFLTESMHNCLAKATFYNSCLPQFNFMLDVASQFYNERDKNHVKAAKDMSGSLRDRLNMSARSVDILSTFWSAVLKATVETVNESDMLNLEKSATAATSTQIKGRITLPK